jgi:hypothetical protein
MAEEDPENTDHEDIESRIRKLKEEAAKLTGDQMISDELADCPSEIEEEFWKNVVAFERASWTQPFDMLVEGGVSLPPPDELDDTQITTKLWEVIRTLALLRAYLDHTDHLSDRELYTHLWNDSLREALVLQPGNPDFACHIDLIGSGSEEDIFIDLKYYADEAQRRRWAKEWPSDPMPDHQQPPFDRDRHLPQSRFGEQSQTH